MLRVTVEELTARLPGTLPELLGFEIVDLRRGCIKARMPVEPRHLAPNGFLHAASIIALADRTPYATSKGAILQMTRALALEWAPHGITVNAMLPGPFATEMNQSLLDDPDLFKEFVAKIPLGRWGELHEIRGLALFLASDASSFVTGAGITIDGGWTVY